VKLEATSIAVYCQTDPLLPDAADEEAVHLHELAGL
jgi:hypothetical protein